LHKLGNRSTAFANGNLLKKLAHAVKQHNKPGLRIFADNQRADRCDAHQKILVKNLTVYNISRRSPQYAPTDHRVRRKIKAKTSDAAKRQKSEPVK
jgi:hypothetical protein